VTGELTARLDSTRQYLKRLGVPLAHGSTPSSGALFLNGAHFPIDEVSAKLRFSTLYRHCAHNDLSRLRRISRKIFSELSAFTFSSSSNKFIWRILPTTTRQNTTSRICPQRTIAEILTSSPRWRRMLPRSWIFCTLTTVLCRSLSRRSTSKEVGPIPYR
jgi:hypothetical protein